MKNKRAKNRERSKKKKLCLCGFMGLGRGIEEFKGRKIEGKFKIKI